MAKHLSLLLQLLSNFACNPCQLPEKSLLGKMQLTKKAHEKSLTSIEQFNGRPKLPGWPGKEGAAPSLGKQWLL
jgi:hypothetical protein